MFSFTDSDIDECFLENLHCDINMNMSFMINSDEPELNFLSKNYKHYSFDYDVMGYAFSLGFLKFAAQCGDLMLTSEELKDDTANGTNGIREWNRKIVNTFHTEKLSSPDIQRDIEYFGFKDTTISKLPSIPYVIAYYTPLKILIVYGNRVHECINHINRLKRSMHNYIDNYAPDLGALYSVR